MLKITSIISLIILFFNFNSFREKLADGWAYSFKTYDKCYKLEVVREELNHFFLK